MSGRPAGLGEYNPYDSDPYNAKRIIRELILRSPVSAIPAAPAAPDLEPLIPELVDDEG